MHSEHHIFSFKPILSFHLHTSVHGHSQVYAHYLSWLLITTQLLNFWALDSSIFLIGHILYPLRSTDCDTLKLSSLLISLSHNLGLPLFFIWTIIIVVAYLVPCWWSYLSDYHLGNYLDSFLVSVNLFFVIRTKSTYFRKLSEVSLSWLLRQTYSTICCTRLFLLLPLDTHFAWGALLSVFTQQSCLLRFGLNIWSYDLIRQL